MPEIKNNFLQGKMNKDFDERLIPNGQYRNAENVEVSTAEDSSVGTVKNILGNKEIGNFVANGKCVGSIANEKTNKIYWFVSTYEKDVIIEYDVEHDVVVPVLVDLNAGEHNAVLKFYGNIITGINIIDDLLFWTDNNSDPKSINIKECIRGTVDFDTHTQLLFEHGSFDGMTVKIVMAGYPNSTFGASYWPPTTPVDEMVKKGHYFYYQRRPMTKLLGLDFNEATDDDGYMRNGWYHTNGGTGNPYGNESNHPGNHNIHYIRHYRNGEFLGLQQIRLFDQYNGTHGRLDSATNGPISGTWAGTSPTDFQKGDVIFGNNIRLDIEERHITVIKPKPLNTFSVKINHTQNLEGTSNIPNLFETKFPRFSYRYKYRDGEFSPFAPFTNPVFNPRYTKDINNSSDVNVYHNKDTSYDIKEPHNKAMVNSIHSVELTDFVTAQTPENVVEIDILYKQEDSPVIYSIGTIKHLDPEWHAWGNNEGTNIGFGKQIRTTGLASSLNYSATQIEHTYAAEGGYNKGKYIVTTENIYAALPANQLLRPWDNVPRKALAQEVTGNRIVYGNYLQNYDLGVVKPKVKVNYSDRSNQIGSFETQGLPSLKSLRNYQLGVVYSDKYGRETPVFTSDEGATNIPWQESDGIKNASKSLQLNTSVVSNFPAWVDSLKFFVKETSNEYYNLTMDRAWVTKKTYELDDSEGHLWISFPSSDRNKISEEDYIVLKKKIGTGEEQINFENKFKVIDIKNEAPDAIKYELVNIGSEVNGSNFLTDTTSGLGMSISNATGTKGRIDREGATNFQFDYSNWKWGSGGEVGNIPLEEDVGSDNETTYTLGTKDLYVSWRRLSGGVGVSSKKYKITGGRKGGTHYFLKLSTPISKIDADIAHINGDSSDITQALLHPNLLFQIEKRILKDSEDFSGKFFVKISKNQITNLIESGEPVSILDKYQVSAKAPTWYWQEDTWTSFSIVINQDGSPTSNYGLTNWDGYDQNPDYTNNSIQIAANNAHGNDTADGKTLRVTDWYHPWDGILTKHNSIGQFFVDAMHVASGQSDASNYAKYNYIPWAGCTKGESATKEDSAWSYPPLKTWLTDFEDKTELLESLEDNDNTNWYNGNLISTSLSSQITSENPDWNDLRVDGWIGSLQNVSRDHPTTQNIPNQINGLEGFVTTNSNHTIGPRRWFSGITGNSTEHGVGVDTKTYSDDGEVGRHFMHLSFFAPGKNLHDGDFAGLDSDDALYGDKSWAANLQGIWGGGHFTGEEPGDMFGTGATGFQHLCMESNNDSSGRFLEATPAPGVGYGYDIRYKELHERQWDPTFGGNGDPDNKIRDFIRNLYPGSQFKFHIDSGEEVYTIKKVVVKKLYNHTSWRKPYNRYIAGSGILGVDYGYIHGSNIATENPAYRSVEQCGLEWLDQVDDAGDYTGTTNPTQRVNFENQIENFGKASNRRVCYIIELDKNPADTSTQEGSGFNPIADDDHMSADIVGGDFANIEFLEPVQSVLLSDLSKFPAIWEIDPKKKEVDLDIYYEASNSIPIKINSNTNELFAPIGCKVEVIDSAITGTARLESWDGTIATFDPGFADFDGSDEIDYTGLSFKFTREDGGFTIAEAGEQELTGVTALGYKTDFVFREDIGDTIRAGLSWYNCFSFGNGLESNRIRDDFNEMFITNGVKASTTTQETYEEERRAQGLIYSGLYNSNSGVNDLNQFIMAEKITKDVNPTYGSIQKLFQRRISLVAFCEDRVLSITSNKDAIYNADGNPQLISTDNVLGDVNPFVGDFGISKNPESFASESYRAYFTDKQRGAVLRLSKDGLTPISKAGMHDWFRDNLSNYTSLIGTYDSYKEDYNLTLANTFGENILFGSSFDVGTELVPISSGVRNLVTNPGVYDGVSFQYPWEQYDVLPEKYNASGTLINPTFGWGTVNQDLTSNADITNHPAIPEGSLQPYVAPVSYIAPVAAVAAIAAYWTIFDDQNVSTGITFATESAALAFIAAHPGYGASPYQNATYSTTLPTSGTNVAGHLYSANFTSSAYTNWGTSQTPPPPAQSGFLLYSDTRRYIDTANHSSNYGVNGWINESSPYASWSSGVLHTWGSGTTIGANGSVERSITSYPTSSWSIAVTKGAISGVITHNSGSNGGILFDRVGSWGTNIDNWVEFRNIGIAQSGGTFSYATGTLNDAYSTASGNASEHTSIYNGDEIHVWVKIKCYMDAEVPANTNSSTWRKYGYNQIAPKITLVEGDTGNPINSNILQNVSVLNPPITATSYNWIGSVGHTSGTLNLSSIGLEDVYPTSGGNYTGNMNGFSSVNAQFGTNSSYQFPSTHNSGQGGSLQDLFNSYAPGFYELVLQVSFKFRDPAQQNQWGALHAASYNQYIEPTKLVNDLRVRINQTHDGPANAHSVMQSYPWMCQQLWEIQKVKIIKGYGVTAPPQAAVVGTPPTSVQTPAVAAIAGVTQVDGIAEVDPVPPHDIPAWTEVNHNNSSWFDDWEVTNTGGGNVAYLHAHTGNNTTGAYPLKGLGYNYSAVTQSGLGQDPNDLIDVTQQLSPNQPISYVVPQDWGYGTTINTSGGGQTLTNTSFVDTSGSGPTNGTPFFHTDNHTTGIVYPGIIDKIPTTKDFENDFMSIITDTMGTYIEISQDISSSPWEIGEWYLVDVEYDATFNVDTGAGYSNANGSFFLYGMGSISEFGTQGWGNPVSHDGVGIYRGSSPYHIQLVQVDRTEYGNSQRVLRAIFKVPAANDSWVTNTSNTGRLDSFKLHVYACTNEVRITKIISKKLDTVTTTGTATDWTSTYNGSSIAQLHSFDSKEVYYAGNKLCFEVRDDQVDKTYKWVQDLSAVTGSLISTPLGWTLSFSVDTIPVTNNFVGELRAWVAPGSANDTLYIEGVDTVGNYEIDFDIDASSVSGWAINGPSGHGATISAGGTHTGSVTNEIGFASDVDTVPSPTGVPALEAGINNIILTDNTQVLQGGSAGSWSFSGFNTSVDSYMYWDHTPGDEKLRFENCPPTDPLVTTSPRQLINANQWIDKPIKRYEQYRIIFDYEITDADIVIYYFNSRGYGFRITSIGANQPINTTGTSTITGTYNEIHTIGDAVWDSEHPTTSGEYVSQLKNTFVIRKSHGPNLLNGHLDNISMTRVYDLSSQPEKTVSFSEDVNGWTSFKSFVPESGTSISKKYFTMMNGGLWQHYTPLKWDNINSQWVDSSIDEAENYNRFYGIPNNSSITAVLNGDPSTVKTFNTLNYEGSQAQVIKPLSAVPTSTSGGITVDNAQAWAQGSNIDGWNCTEIKTDIDTGNIVEFIKKEGKWFNYIKGKPTSLSDIGDTSRFSVQGIGEASAVTEVTY
jgi:hypothetical protein